VDADEQHLGGRAHDGSSDLGQVTQALAGEAVDEQRDEVGELLAQ
jgi:hypothetical protein